MIENGNEPNGMGADALQAAEDLRVGQLPDGAIAKATTAGEKMRLAREASGTHINTLAATLKVNVKILEALENDQYDELPGIPFTRALAASICRNLNMDSQPVLDLLPSSQPQKLQEPQIQSPVVLNKGGSPWFGWLKKPITWLVLLAIVGSIIYWILPYVLEKTAPAPLQQLGDSVVEELESGLDLNGVQSTGGLVENASVLPEVMEVNTATANTTVGNAASGVGSALIAPTTAGSATSSVEPSSPLVSDLAVTNLQNAQNNAQSTVQNNTNLVSATVTTAAIPLDKALVLQATGESWVQVKDAHGKVLHSTTMQAGDVLPVVGAKPYKVVLGKQENIKAFALGKPYAFGVAGQMGTARFTMR